MSSQIRLVLLRLWPVRLFLSKSFVPSVFSRSLCTSCVVLLLSAAHLTCLFNDVFRALWWLATSTVVAVVLMTSSIVFCWEMSTLELKASVTLSPDDCDTNLIKATTQIEKAETIRLAVEEAWLSALPISGNARPSFSVVVHRFRCTLLLPRLL